MTDQELYEQTLELYDDPSYAKQYSINVDDRVDEWMFEAFLPYLKKGDSVLDIGCTAGRDTNQFSLRGYHVKGLDISKQLIDIARQKYPQLDFLVGDMLNLPFADRTFDGIWSHAAIVHLPSQAGVERAVQESARVLKLGGYAMLLTKARKSGDPETLVRDDKLSGKKRYFRFQIEEDFIKICEKAGLKLVTSRFYNEQEGQQYEILRDENWLFTIAQKESE